MSLFPSRRVWDALAATYVEAWISQRRSSTRHRHSPRPIAPVASLSSFRAPQCGNKAHKLSPGRSTGPCTSLMAAEFVQGATSRHSPSSDPSRAPPRPKSNWVSTRSPPLSPGVFLLLSSARICEINELRRPLSSWPWRAAVRSTAGG